MKALLPEEALPAPDVAGTVDAWRAWRVLRRDGGYVLASVIKPTIWPHRQVLYAKCLHVRSPLNWLCRRQPHAAPEASCECGIYAAGLELVGDYLDEASMPPAVARVLGRVALWGTVVECERGYRAAFAYPTRIYVPADARGRNRRGTREAVEGLAAYGVPVELLGARCADAPHVLARQAA